MAEAETTFPLNIEWKTRDVLNDLNHTVTIHEIIKANSSLMLQIKNMSDTNHPYYFMKRLKPWAHDELMRQEVTTVQETYEAADRLTDWQEKRQLKEKSVSRAGGKEGLRPKGKGFKKQRFGSS